MQVIRHRPSSETTVSRSSPRVKATSIDCYSTLAFSTNLFPAMSRVVRM